MQESLGFSPVSQPRGSDQKWIGGVVNESHDASRWLAKRVYWERKVAHGGADQESKSLWMERFEFYSSLSNRTKACDYPLLSLQGVSPPPPPPEAPIKSNIRGYPPPPPLQRRLELKHILSLLKYLKLTHSIA